VKLDAHRAALVLDDIATLLELTGGDRFRVKAYRNAARAVEGVRGDLVEALRSGALEDVRGLGGASIAVIRELAEQGRSSLHEKLKASTPSGMVEMLDVPGLGAGRIARLHEELGVDSLADLEAAARDGRIARLHGFGEKTQARILEGIDWVRGAAGRRLLLHALEGTHRVAGALSTAPGAAEVLTVGGVRRRVETAAAAELLVVMDEPDATGACDALNGLPSIGQAAPGGPSRRAAADEERHADVREPDASGRFSDGFGVRAWCVPPAEAPTMHLFLTGSAAHVDWLIERARERGLELRPDGLRRGSRRRKLRDEAALYRALDLHWIPPELREQGGGIETRLDRLDELVYYEDVRGCFHCHTTYSDGKATVAQMAEAARERGWRYLGISDHSKAAFYAGGLTAGDLRRQHAEIDAWNRDHGDELWLLKGLEADILPDGTIDFADEPAVLESLDFVIASVHSSFSMDGEAMTRRVERAIADPHVRILGHATGRLLLSRDGYALDVERVLRAAAEHDVVVELNCDPRRMELDWRWWPLAASLGVRCAINPDAHSTLALENVRLGAEIARKGWLTTDDVLNCQPLDHVLAAFERD